MKWSDIKTLAHDAVIEFEAGHLVAGGRKIHEIEGAFLDLASDLGFQSTPEEEKCKKEVESLLVKCKKICEAPPVAGNDPPAVGKLGDGVLLTAILNALLKFLAG